ncbi:MAG: hypothetical protein ABI353_11070 [Isosphaeraceae bacterium]
MSLYDAAPIVTNRFVQENDEEFAATLEGLRLELAPTTIMESVWVDLVLLAIHRLRTSARDETDDSSLDGKWMRFQSMTSRSLDNAMSKLEKSRRAAKKAAESAATQDRPAPSPAPAEALPTRHAPKTPKKAAAQIQETPSKSTTTREDDSPDLDSQVPQRSSNETNALKVLLGTLEPDARLGFLEQFRDEVNEMLAEGFSPEEVMDTIPVLSLEDVEAFQSGRPISNVPNEPAKLAI